MANKVVVLNLSDTTQHLRTHAGNSVSILPSNRPVPIDAIFVEWIEPHPSVVRILYYIDGKGNKVDKLPTDTPPVIPPATAVAPDTASPENRAEDYKPKDFEATV